MASSDHDMSAKPLRVLIADDHALMRRALGQLLADGGFRVGDTRVTPDVVEVEAFDAVVEAMTAAATQLLLIDLMMPGMAGAASLRALRDAHPQTKIIVVTGSQHRRSILECLGAGIHGYVLKSFTPGMIVHAIEVVMAGEIYLPPEIANVPVAVVKVEGDAGQPTPSGNGEAGAIHFTKRQRDVLEQLGQGRSTKEIARTLGLGEGTVKVHLAAIYRALNARNRTEAVLLASKLLPLAS